MSKKPETKLRTKIVKAMRQRGAWVGHPHGSQYSAGLPDLLWVYRGYGGGFEVKTPENKKGMTDNQAATIDAIKQAGGVAAEIRSVKEAMHWLDLIDQVKARKRRGT
jgi:hypothetical protein